MIKPNTLCRVIRLIGSARELNGKLVTVTSPLMPMFDIDHRLFLGHTIDPRLPLCGWVVDGMGPEYLQPISDPDTTLDTETPIGITEDDNHACHA